MRPRATIRERKSDHMAKEERDIELKIGSISDIVGGEGDAKVEKDIERSVKKGINAPYAKVLLRLALVTLLVASIAMFATGVLRYQELVRERETLKVDKERLEDEIEELRYLLDSPVDRDYIIRMAREKLGLNLPDEIVYYNDTNEKK
jgi:cell division protein FtsB